MSTAHTLTLRARCVLHSFYIPLIFILTCAEQGKRTPEPPTNATVTTLATNTNAMHECDMKLTYLRGGLSTCSVVWASVQYFFLKFIKCLMQLYKNFF